MKQIYYDVTVRLKEAVGGIHTHRYGKCHKVKYTMKGDNVKLRFNDKNGDITTEEFSNVSHVTLTKYKK